MASLSSLKSDVAPAVNPGLKSIYVTNNSISQNNGGRCCLFTVPDGVTQVTFELWGGGPPGAAARCCQQTRYTGSGGQYARRTVATAAGCTYTLCAAGSSCCCSGCGPGFSGYTSYVSGSGIATTCAGPGHAGSTGCFILSSACCTSCVTQGTASGDFCMPSVRGNRIQAGECVNTQKWYMGGAYEYGRFNGTRSLCWSTIYCNACCWGWGQYPAGPGSNAATCSGVCRCGTPGYGGIIKVTYG